MVPILTSLTETWDGAPLPSLHPLACADSHSTQLKEVVANTQLFI